MENELLEVFSDQWNEKVKQTFDTYLSVPNVSPAFDSNWQESGHIEKAVSLFETWAKENAPSKAKVYVQRIENLTPLIVIDIPANNYRGDDCVLLYGHLDKQPPMDGWKENLEPFQATYIDDKIYGRGSADDGYAIFSSVLACNYLEENNIAHARHVIIIEACEESGSPDLPAHLDKLDRTLEVPLGEVSLVICLDSGCLTYDHLWITRSLRGLLQINVGVRVLDQGTHSGGAGGIVPSAFHIIRELLDRISEPKTGEIKLDALKMNISESAKNAAENVAKILGDTSAHGLPFAKGVQPIHESVAAQIIANTYEPQLEVIGLEGIPDIENAGNVLRPHLEMALSFRLPPKVDPQVGAAAVVDALVRDRSFDAQVSVVVDSLASGWEAPEMESWLEDSLRKSSNDFFGQDVQFMGEGGTIPFMAMLGEKYPNSQFMVTGVLGPESNAHGPNEFLHLPTCMKVTASVAQALESHGAR